MGPKYFNVNDLKTPASICIVQSYGETEIFMYALLFFINIITIITIIIIITIQSFSLNLQHNRCISWQQFFVLNIRVTCLKHANNEQINLTSCIITQNGHNFQHTGINFNRDAIYT